MSLAAEKKAARIAAKARRAEVASTARSGAACAALIDWLGPPDGRVLAGYLPIQSEADPRAAMATWARSAPVAVPQIVAPASPLVFRRWSEDAVLERAEFGVLIPKDAPQVVPDIVILPLLAFDRQGQRLGYGGGFYDRTLEALGRNGSPRAVGFAYSGQEMAEVPHDPLDQPLAAVATERGIRVFFD